MLIEFYYIDGISEIDTPSFLGQSSQDIRLFFANYKVTEINTDFFYPPHYKNSIKFSTEDLQLQSKVNYLSLYYNNKYYYYFIDGITYISEDVFSLNIHMDTLLTHCYDTQFQYAFVERMHINRWYQENNVWYINRDYIRENFSKGEFDIIHYVEVNNGTWYDNCNSELPGIVVIVQTEFSYQNTKSPSKYIVGDTHYFTSRCAYSTSMIPYYYGDFDYTLKSSDNTFTGTASIRDGMLRLGELSTTVNMFYIPMNLLGNALSYNNETHTVVFDTDKFDVNNTSGNKDFELMYSGTPNASDPVLHVDVLYKIVIGEGTNINFERNTSIYNTSSSIYEPCLLDENYYYITFGEKDCYTTYPLHLLTLCNLRVTYTADFTTGSRVYNMYGKNNISRDGYQMISANEDVVNATVIASQPITFDLVTNQYQQWAVQNRATGFFHVVNGIVEVGGGMLKSYFTESPIGTMSGVKNTLQDGLSYAETQVNKTLAPNDARSNGTFNTEFVGNMCRQRYIVRRINDYKYCTQMYKMFGNKVNRLFDTAYDFMRAIHNRYYFNYVKLKDCDISLSYIESQFIVEDIKRRYMQGVRLWEINHETHRFNANNIGDYRFDNVELDFIE